MAWAIVVCFFCLTLLGVSNVQLRLQSTARNSSVHLHKATIKLIILEKLPIVLFDLPGEFLTTRKNKPKHHKQKPAPDLTASEPQTGSNCIRA